jgi:peptidoglycan lytic transglycosylase
MLMQTKLRIVCLLFVASLLWIFPASAATQRTEKRTARPTPTRYIGVASWYGGEHQGRKMANGQRFDCRQLTAASWYFPLGTTVRVVNLENGKAELVTITDRGPNLRLDRIIDLSEAAADKLGYIRQGLTSVFLFPVVSIDPEQATIPSHLIEPFSTDVSVRFEEQDPSRPYAAKRGMVPRRFSSRLALLSGIGA